MSVSLKELGDFDYIPRDVGEFTQFLMHYAIQPEMEPYEHCSGLESVAEDVAERAYQPGKTGDEMVADYQDQQALAA